MNPDSPSERTPIRPATAGACSAARILLVEDDEEMREPLVTALELAGYEVIQASNGLEGVTLAHEHLPELVISDYQMPGVTGYMLLAILRRTEHLASVPFILITGQTAIANHRASMNLGVDDYLAKPFTIQDLLASVSARLSKARTVREQSQRKLHELRSNLSRRLPHEMNTPLAGICGLASLLREDFDRLSRTEALEMIELIQESGEQLGRTVKNYLAVADLELTRHDPDKLAALRRGRAEHAGRLAAEQAARSAVWHRRAQDLECQPAENILAHIGPDQLARVIHELVDNACKFSAAGTPVRLGVKLQGPHAEFVVSDSGCGMTPEEVTSLDAFVQFDRRPREERGSGIGLHIARSIVELHGGAFTILSTPNRGTTVTVRLPQG